MPPKPQGQSGAADPEAAILQVLSHSGTELSLSDVLTRLKARDVEAVAAIKAAILRLMGEYKIEMTEDRKLRLIKRRAASVGAF